MSRQQRFARRCRDSRGVRAGMSGVGPTEQEEFAMFRACGPIPAVVRRAPRGVAGGNQRTTVTADGLRFVPREAK